MKNPPPSPQFIEQSVIETLSQFQPISHADYAELARISGSTAFARFRKLSLKKIIFIHSWRRGTNGSPAPLYAIGNHPDAERPTAYTNREKNRRWENKLKTEDKGKGWLRFLRKKRQYHKRKMKEDRMYADRTRAKNTQWARKKLGAKPRLPNVSKIDPLLTAILFPKTRDTQKDEAA